MYLALRVRDAFLAPLEFVSINSNKTSSSPCRAKLHANPGARAGHLGGNGTGQEVVGRSKGQSPVLSCVHNKIVGSRSREELGGLKSQGSAKIASVCLARSVLTFAPDYDVEGPHVCASRTAVERAKVLAFCTIVALPSSRPWYAWHKPEQRPHAPTSAQTSHQPFVFI